MRIDLASTISHTDGLYLADQRESFVVNADLFTTRFIAASLHTRVPSRGQRPILAITGAVPLSWLLVITAIRDFRPVPVLRLIYLLFVFN